MAIRVVVSGSGTMGRQVMQAVQAAEDLEVVGVLEKFSSGERYVLPAGDAVPLRQAPGGLVDLAADVLVDFSNAEWSEQVVPAAIAAGVRPVVGTSGLSPAFVAVCAEACATARLGGVIASNFALGAVMMMHLSRVAAPFFDAVEVIEQHHDGKVDAPSGTAMTTAREMRAARGSDFQRNVAERETLPEARGSELGGVTLHAVRLPGLVAHQTVLFGGVGETLTIRHDSTSRESFMPGVLRAVRSVMEQEGLVEGLDRLLGLRE
jgi:4-hydroxy-tetrahydrodipicolinate reductase